MTGRLFPALLRYWRDSRGISQLALAIAADVSARHVSFLESGRSKPSEAMLLRLAATLAVPLRERNAMLLAAGFPARFPEPGLGQVAPAVAAAIDRMMRQQEPYPLAVLSAGYDVLRTNRAADLLFRRFVAEPDRLPEPLNMFTLLFDPRLARPFVTEWHDVGRHMLARLHREALQHPGRHLQNLISATLAFPGVPAAWRRPDFALPGGATLEIGLRRDDLSVRFLTTVTVFSAPQDVTLDELRIESYFPLDERTRTACEALARTT